MGLALSPSQGTLVPALGEGIDEENTKNLFIEGVDTALDGREKFMLADGSCNVKTI